MLLSYAPEKWSLKEVLGHIMDAERIFSYRALCIARGEEQPLPGFDEQQYARVAGYDRLPVQKGLQQYNALRVSTRLLLEQLLDSAWTATGVSNQKPISVRALAYIIAGHERHHMGVIAERYGMYRQK
ncbi:DinB family protein [bacterium]|nr:DinB family protein [bacterium]MCI0606168.1 DinB family protein [bacterium]